MVFLLFYFTACHPPASELFIREKHFNTEPGNAIHKPVSAIR